MAKPFPLFTDRWRGLTYDVAPKHRGPFQDLIVAIWEAKGALRHDMQTIATAARLDERQCKSFWAACAHKFTVQDGMIRHEYVDGLLAHARKIAAKMQHNGAKGGKKTQAKQRARQANAKLYDTEGIVPLTEETIPSTVCTSSQSPQAASPPSPLGGGGDAPMTAEIDILPDSARAIRDELIALNRIGKVSSSEIAQFRKAVQGERAGCVILHPSYDPPEAVAAIINQPKLKLVQGDHHEG